MNIKIRNHDSISANNIFFVADEHYNHPKILIYANRPFRDIYEMTNTLINNHNSIVGENDVTFHLGDFTFGNRESAQAIINNLNGEHFFIRGSHDGWMNKWPYPEILELEIDKTFLVLCHYAMRVWPRSHYNSIQLFGHSHSKLPPQGKQWDVGVDNNNFFPVSFDKILRIMTKRPDNFNYIKNLP